VDMFARTRGEPMWSNSSCPTARIRIIGIKATDQTVRRIIVAEGLRVDAGECQERVANLLASAAPPPTAQACIL
jgi:hypothetical protein